jgi:hypothetical protein
VTDLANSEDLRITLLAFAGNVALAVLISGLGFALMHSRQVGARRSLRFALLGLFAPLLLPALTCALLIGDYSSTSKFLAESATTTGEVVGLTPHEKTDGESYSAVVTFTTPDGQSVTFDDRSQWCAPPCNEIGDEVPVRYRISSPEDAIISSGSDIWLTTGIMALLTVVFLPIALMIAWQAYTKLLPRE